MILIKKNVGKSIQKSLNHVYHKKIGFKKCSLSVSTIIALLALCSLSILAQFNMQSSFNNVLSVGKMGASIVEDFTPPPVWNDEKVIKKVRYENTGDINLVLRIQYSESWISSSGDLLPNAIGGVDVCKKNWTKDATGAPVKPNTLLGTGEWVDGGDGWYYYKNVFTPGKNVYILDSIEKSATFPATHKGAKYKLSFIYEVLTTKTDVVSKAWNKTPTINGDSITWS
ncbi:MAG: hypothetical protein RR481_07450 [Longicatena sp.]